jgi:hypothetical protein
VVQALHGALGRALWFGRYACSISVWGWRDGGPVRTTNHRKPLSATGLKSNRDGPGRHSLKIGRVRKSPGLSSAARSRIPPQKSIR